MLFYSRKQQYLHEFQLRQSIIKFLNLAEPEPPLQYLPLDSRSLSEESQ